MKMRLTVPLVVVMLAAGLTASAQGTEQTERFSQTYKIARDGRFSIENIAGDITIGAGTGDAAVVEAVKRTRGDRRELARVVIAVEAGSDRVDVRTRHTGRNDHVSVDYTILLPPTVRVEATSISGSLKISGVQAAVRAGTMSGNVTIAAAGIESARSISGNVDLVDVSTDGTLAAMSVSGRVTGKNLKARSIEVSTVSGEVALADVTVERLGVRSTSGNLGYSGAIPPGSRFGFNAHSGAIRLALPDTQGFRLTADTFSGVIRSALPLTLDRGYRFSGDLELRRRPGSPQRSIDGRSGDGGATLILQTFSGDIVISKR